MSQLFFYFFLIHTQTLLKIRIFILSPYKKRTKHLHRPPLRVTFLGFDLTQQNDSSYLIKQISGLAPAVGHAISPCEQKGCNPWPIDHFCMEICLHSKPSTGHWKWFFPIWIRMGSCPLSPHHHHLMKRTRKAKSLICPLPITTR